MRVLSRLCLPPGFSDEWKLYCTFKLIGIDQRSIFCVGSYTKHRKQGTTIYKERIHITTSVCTPLSWWLMVHVRWCLCHWHSQSALWEATWNDSPKVLQKSWRSSPKCWALVDCFDFSFWPSSSQQGLSRVIIDARSCDPVLHHSLSWSNDWSN